MRKQVHKKTVIRDGREETIVTEDTNIEQDNEGPEELQDSMQRVIDQFMEQEADQTTQQNAPMTEWCHQKSADVILPINDVTVYISDVIDAAD